MTSRKRAGRSASPMRFGTERNRKDTLMAEMIGQLRWQDGIDIGIITFLIYRALQIVRGSRAMQMIIGLAIVLVAYVISRALGLFTLNWILDNFLGSII